MNIYEQVAYLKGLAEGMELDTDSNEGKMIAAILDVLGEMTDNLQSMEFDLDIMNDELDSVDEELDYLFDEAFKCKKHHRGHHHGDCCGHDHYYDDEDDYEDYDGDIYEVICPNCGERILLDEEDLDEGELTCYICGQGLEIDFSEHIEDDEEFDEDNDN